MYSAGKMDDAGGGVAGRELDADDPRDARIVRAMGIAEGEYAPRVLHQFLELCHRYVVDADAEIHAEHAGKNNIDPDDVRLAIQSKINFSLSQPPPPENGKEHSRFLQVAPNVYHALKHGNAVVALESTIISHGMPYPQNLETAKEVEAIVRQNGAVPATIAILDGVPCIGLNDEQLERLAKLGSNSRKTARRDIPHVIAAHENGATTVSATMFFASKVGISVFVTGGIGGVHRHGEQTMDISSDLTELGRTPVAVISAGVKSILDIPKTLEYLETQGVTVAAYRTNEFPAFFSKSSGCQVPCRLDSPEECARLINANLNVRLGSGMLIAVPIPKEHAAYGHVIESAIERALKEANDKQVTGNAATPFLLSRVNELTGGASLAANIALVKNNADVGAKIAVSLANLRHRTLRSAI